MNEVTKCCSLVQGLNLSSEEKDTIQGITINLPGFWRGKEATDTTMMHGRKRVNVRELINRAVTIREANREAEKDSRVIKSVLATQTERYNMTCIKTPNGRVVSDEEEIRNICLRCLSMQNHQVCMCQSHGTWRWTLR